MSGLNINREKCSGCGLCVESCPQLAIGMEDGLACADESKCVLCGLCVDACPQGAISLEKKTQESGFSGWRGVYVFIQQEGGVPLPVGLELLSKGRELADTLGHPLCAVLFGGGEDALALLAEHGPDIIYHGADARLAQPDEQYYAPLLARLIQEQKPAILLFGATDFGRSLAPRVAARVQTGLTADCTGLEINPETRLLEQTRPAFGGNLMATIICPGHRPQMATVRPKVFAVQKQRRGTAIIPLAFKGDSLQMVRVLSEETAGLQNSISGAPFIIAVGRGIGNQKNLQLAQRLAELLGAQLGASRPLVDAGWLPYKHQIGQTGCSVSPALLITFGISGAIQHLAGIGGAKRIVAVNNDPDAPIFDVAHEAVVGDCQEIMREMIAQLEAAPQAKATTSA